MKLQAPDRGRWICLAMLVAAGPGASSLEAQPVPPEHSVRSPLAVAAAAAVAARESAAAGAVASSSLQSARLASAENVIPPVPALPGAVVVPAGGDLRARPPETPATRAVGADLRVSLPETLPGVAEVAPPATFPSLHGRPSPLVPLYLSFAALQVADVASTHQALKAGGREANPVVKGFAGNEAAMVAVKAGATAGTILLTERLWKKNRPAAVILMLGLNGAYAAIVAHNYRR